MIERLINDPVWRRKNKLCVWLAAIPAFGWMSFLFMARRSGQKKYRTAGVIYGVLSMIAYFGMYTEDLLRQINHAVTGNWGTLALIGEALAEYGMIIMALLWPICFAHAMSWSKGYLQYLALRQAGRGERHPLLSAKLWRRDNLRWTIWSYLPVVGGFSVFFAAGRMGSKKLKWFGMVSAVVACAMAISGRVLRAVNFSLSNSMESLTVGYCLGMWIIQMMIAAMIREEYLESWAPVWSEDTRKQPNLSIKKWRKSNSAWQRWTFFPVAGGIGIALAGVQGNNKKFTVHGVIFCCVSALLSVLTLCLDQILGEGALSVHRSEILDCLNIATWFLYGLTLFYGTWIRWDVLKGRAAALQGYSSEFERDADLQKRLQARKVPVTQPPKEETPARKVEVQTPPAGRVDLNQCTQEQLMQLPGVGVVQAKQAMEYRSQHNGFQSVDEFVEVLQIKPHFAVQIFEKATVAEPAAPKPESGGVVRRRIDF